MPIEHDDARGTPAALTDREQRLHVEGLELFLIEHLDLEATAFQIAHAIGELDGPKPIGRLVDEIAGQEDAVGKGLAGNERLVRRLRTDAQDLELAEAVAGVGLSPLLRLAARQVFLEGIASQERTQRQVGGKALDAHLARIGRVADECCPFALARTGLAEGIAAQQQPIQFLARAPRAHHDEALRLEPGGGQQLDCGFALAAEAGGGGGALKRAFGPFVDGAGGGPKRELLARQ